MGFPGFVLDISILAKLILLLMFWVLAGVSGCLLLYLGDGVYAGPCFPLQSLCHGARGQAPVV